MLAIPTRFDSESVWHATEDSLSVSPLLKGISPLSYALSSCMTIRQSPLAAPSTKTAFASQPPSSQSKTSALRNPSNQNHPNWTCPLPHHRCRSTSHIAQQVPLTDPPSFLLRVCQVLARTTSSLNPIRSLTTPKSSFLSS
jgi:hypothetical protein